ncbi:MAG: hypothetical protein H6714_04800 [Myxococcales bacterium]|nr:hypothetical protein [Myxococcales bacterium]
MYQRQTRHASLAAVALFCGLTGCQPSRGATPVTQSGQSQSELPSTSPFVATDGHVFEERVFEPRRGRFVLTKSETIWSTKYYELTANHFDGEWVTGISSFYPLTVARLSRALPSDSIPRAIEAWPMQAQGGCPAPYVEGLAGGGHPTAPTKSVLNGMRMDGGYRLMFDNGGVRLASAYCWTDPPYALQSTFADLSAETLGQLHFAHWDKERPITYGAELESADANAAVQYYRPNHYLESEWRDMVTSSRDDALNVWNQMMVTLNQAEQKQYLPVVKRYDLPPWLPGAIMHEIFDVFELRSQPTPYLGELYEQFILPGGEAFLDASWHQRVGLPFPSSAEAAQSATQTVNEIWFESSASLLGYAWEASADAIFSSYGGVPLEEDVEQLRVMLLAGSSYGPHPFFDNVGKQSAEVTLRFDLAATAGRFSLEIRSLTDAPQDQIWLAGTIAEYLEQPTPLAFSATAPAMTLPGALPFVTSEMSGDIDQITAADAVLKEIAERTFGQPLRPRPEIVVRRILIPELAWETHPKLIQYASEIREARSAYHAILLDVIRQATASGFGSGTAVDGQQINLGQRLIEQLKIALYQWALKMRLSERI